MAKKLMPLLLCPLLVGWHWFEPAARKNQKGIEAFDQKKYTEALELFLSAKGLKPEAQALKNNTAAALYELKKYQEAVNELSSVDPDRLKGDQAGLHYNLGNAYYRLGQFPKALESYKRSLQLAPDDIACKKNFELTLKKIEEERQQPQQNRQQNQQSEMERQKQKYEAMMQFLNQNEKQQMEKKKRKTTPTRNEKDW